MRGSHALHVAALILILGIPACGKKEAPKASVPAKPTPTAVASTTDKDILNTLSDSSKPAKSAGNDRDHDMDKAIGIYKREHPFADANELVKQPAFIEKLGPVLQEAVKNHAFGDRVQKSVDFAAQLKAGNGTPGSYRLDLKVDNYTPERTDRLLGTVLSGDPERLIKFVTAEVSEAAVEFSLSSDQDRASNGVTVQPNQPPPPP